MGYDVDDPRGEQIRENFRMRLYDGKARPKPVKPGPRTATIPARAK